MRRNGHAKIWGKSVPERGSSMYKGPEVGKSVAHWRKGKKTGVFGRGVNTGVGGTEEIRELGRGQIMRVLS